MRKLQEKRSNKKEVKKVITKSNKKNVAPKSTGKKSVNVVKKETVSKSTPIKKENNEKTTALLKPSVKIVNSKVNKVNKVNQNKKNSRTLSILENGMVKMTCNLCKKPEEVKKEDAGWKTLCAPCFMKVRGKLTRCAACKIEFFTLSDPNSACYCYDCSLGMSNGGAKHNCAKCKKIFYVSKNSKSTKNTCYDCYLKATGKESKCTSCTTKIWVKPEDLKWKTKCYNCYIHNN